MYLLTSWKQLPPSLWLSFNLLTQPSKTYFQDEILGIYEIITNELLLKIMHYRKKWGSCSKILDSLMAWLA